jgi:hypothetical protein
MPIESAIQNALGILPSQLFVTFDVLSVNTHRRTRQVIADVLSGTYAFGAILAALNQRESTGLGQLVDVSMLESVLAPLRSGMRERIMSPSGASILTTSAPRSASSRVQCGPAIVVVKSSTLRPDRARVTASSS